MKNKKIKTNSEIILSILNRLDKPKDSYYSYNVNIWNYFVEFNYDREYNCDSYGCTNEGICRCSRLTCFELTDAPSISAILKHLLNNQNIDNNVILHYSLDRILRSLKMYDDVWEAEGIKGYYGEELEVSLNYDVQSKLIKYLNDIKDLSDVDMIKYCLKLEYGYLLDEINKVSNCSIKKSTISNIHCANKEYSRKLDTQQSDLYKNHELPLCVVLKTDTNNLKLLDGYHRFVTAINDQKTEIPVIVLE